MRLSKILYSTKRAIVNLGCYFFDALVFVFIKPVIVKQDKKLVLLIRPDAIGDFIVWSNSASAYRKLYPGSEFQIYLLGNPACENLAMKSGLFDVFLPLDRKKFMLNGVYRFSTWKSISSFGFDTIIYPSYSREFASGDLLMKRLQADRKIGIRSDNAIDDYFWNKIGDGYFTKLHEIQVLDSHELMKNEAFIHSLGFTDFEAGLPDLSFCDRTKGFEDSTQLPTKASLNNQPYFVIFPGARIELRKWPESNFVAIADYIFEQTGWKGILLGTKGEFAVCEAIKNKSRASLLNLAGETDLIEMIQLIGESNLFIGNETSGIHIAIAQKVPSVCVLGGGHFGRFMPYPPALRSKNNVISSIAMHQMACFNCDWNCIYKTGKNNPVPCVELISVETAKKEIDSVLRQL